MRASILVMSTDTNIKCGFKPLAKLRPLVSSNIIGIAAIPLKSDLKISVINHVCLLKN